MCTVVMGKSNVIIMMKSDARACKTDTGVIHRIRPN